MARTRAESTKCLGAEHRRHPPYCALLLKRPNPIDCTLIGSSAFGQATGPHFKGGESFASCAKSNRYADRPDSVPVLVPNASISRFIRWSSETNTLASGELFVRSKARCCPWRKPPPARTIGRFLVL